MLGLTLVPPIPRLFVWLAVAACSLGACDPGRTVEPQPIAALHSALSRTYHGFTGPGPLHGHAVAMSADGKAALVSSETQIQLLLNPGPPAWKLSMWKFGTPGGNALSLSADGSVFVIGSRYLRTAYFFAYDAAVKSWVLTSGISRARSAFGASVAMSRDGRSALVGDPSDNCVYYYRYEDATKRWQEAQAIHPTDAAWNNFGESIALSADGSTAVFTNPNADAFAGGAYVYTFDPGSLQWRLEQRLTATPGTVGMGYKSALSADGNQLLLGAPFSASNSGKVVAFSRCDGRWTSGVDVTIAGAPPSRLFGYGIAMTDDGKNAVITAPRDNAAGLLPGSIYQFEYGTAWREVEQFVPRESAPGDDLGRVLSGSADGSAFVVGASPLYGVYFYAVSSGPVPDPRPDAGPCPADAGSSDPMDAGTCDADAGTCAATAAACSAVPLGSVAAGAAATPLATAALLLCLFLCRRRRPRRPVS